MTRLYLLIGGLSAVLILLASVWFLGGQAAREKARSDQMRDHINTRERIDHATDTDLSPDDARDRLRDLAK